MVLYEVVLNRNEGDQAVSYTRIIMVQVDNLYYFIYYYLIYLFAPYYIILLPLYTFSLTCTFRSPLYLKIVLKYIKMLLVNYFF